MAAPKGHPQWGGRKKGTPNKTTANIREAFVQAFDQLGGVPALVDWAKLNKSEYYKLVSKVIPIDVTSAGQAIGQPQAFDPATLPADTLLELSMALKRVETITESKPANEPT